MYRNFKVVWKTIERKCVGVSFVETEGRFSDIQREILQYLCVNAGQYPSSFDAIYTQESCTELRETIKVGTFNTQRYLNQLPAPWSKIHKF